MKDNFEDIIGVQYPVSTARPRMAMHERAAQFSPFAALTGYDTLIDESEKEVWESFD